jgi:hypothetical protein
MSCQYTTRDHGPVVAYLLLKDLSEGIWKVANIHASPMTRGAHGQGKISHRTPGYPAKRGVLCIDASYG